jgi:lipid-A-disaccharide synthase
MKMRKVYIIAGEASGDNIGSKLMAAMKERGKFEFKGIGGSKMQALGFESLFPMREISMMGFVEVIPKIPLVKKRIAETVKDIIAYRPQVLITIDSFGFNKRVVKAVRKVFGRRIRIVHYVAPTVWAYKPKRAELVAKLFDHQILILPFEKPFFDKAGAKSTYVGHPVVEDKLNKKLNRKALGIPPHVKVLLIMPGSRLGEIKRHAPIFAEVFDKLRAGSDEPLYAVIPTLPHLMKELKLYFKENAIISADSQHKEGFFAASDFALIKSGTSSVEMMLWKIPCVVAYKVNLLTSYYLRLVLKIKYASIANLILDKELIPEFIQKNCTTSKIYRKLSELMHDKKEQQLQRAGFAKVLKMLGLGGKKRPSAKAAEVVCKLLG